MKTSAPRWNFRADKLAFAVTIAAALLPSLITLREGVGSPRWWALLGCGVAFVAVGWVEQTDKTPRGRSWRLARDFALHTVILALTRLGMMSVLAAFPLVGHAVACLRPLVAGLYITALYVGMMWGGLALGGRGSLVSMGSSLLAGFVFVAVFMRIAVREKTARAEAERLSTELAAANTRLRQQAANIAELAMTRERNRVAREIHDSLGHALTTMAVQLEVAETVQVSEPARAGEAVKKAHALAKHALEEVRRSVGTLRAEVVGPLAPRMRGLAVSDAGLAVSFSVLGEPRTLPADVEHGLFRAAQEGLTNVRKHAAAKSAEITLDYREARLVALSVADDGQGSAGSGRGLGLTGLRERAALLGGALTAGNRPEGGFRLRVEVPS